MKVDSIETIFTRFEGFCPINHRIKSCYERLLLNNHLVSENIEKRHKQIPQVHILDEKIIGGIYFREQTLDILSDNYRFSPIALSFLRINMSNRKAIDHRLLMPLEEATHREGVKWKIITEDIVEAEDSEEINKFLIPPAYGRLAKLIIDNHVIAEMIEFVSESPNKEIGVSVLDYLAPHIATEGNLKRQLEDMLLHIKQTLEMDPKIILKWLLEKLPEEVRAEILSHVIDFEHIALMIPPELKAESLDSVANRAGFNGNHQMFASAILAKELGSLVFKKEVPTQIFKAWGLNRKKHNIGIELFLPQENRDIVNGWILQGMGSHIAFKVKSEISILKLLDIANDFDISIPSFMKGIPQRNEKERVIVLYYDIEFRNIPFRLEFCTKY